MKQNISILIGGVQGEGVVSTGLNLMKTFSSLGYFTYANRNFSSRIKGGTTTLNMNINVDKSHAVSDRVDIVLAMDLDTIEGCTKLLHNEGILLYDSVLKVDTAIINSIKAFAIPITTVTKELGAPNMKSTSAIAFLGRFLNMPEEVFISSFTDRYRKKGAEVINKNLEILSSIYQQELDFKEATLQLLPPKKQSTRAVMMGNDAIALGALVAGCRFIASYPITPASEIMEYLSNQLPKYGGIMLQVEDEIAAVNAIIGASYGGVRSLTATSGPGISLMLEGIGLAGMAEIPIVIVDAQRAGPSTGLPTKHEQSDLFTMYYGGHGEYPSIILTPSSIEECFYETVRAFNLAEIYQCPVILLSDLTLSLSPQTIECLDFSKISIDRGNLLLEVPEEEQKQTRFERFKLTEDGISPRVIPGIKGGIHHVTGLEHNQTGGPNDSPINRKSMMEKRMKKTLPLSEGKEVIIEALPNSNNKILYLTFGSTYGVLEEAAKASNASIDIGKIKMLKPLPYKELDNALNQYDHIVIVENNYHGQLSKIIKSELGYHNKIRSVVKYDGNPYSIDELKEEIGGAI